LESVLTANLWCAVVGLLTLLIVCATGFGIVWLLIQRGEGSPFAIGLRIGKRTDLSVTYAGHDEVLGQQLGRSVLLGARQAQIGYVPESVAGSTTTAIADPSSDSDRQPVVG
jgi:hypothetical protein